MQGTVGAGMICNARFCVTATAILSYSTDLVAQSRMAAPYLAACSEGANPAEIPVQAPSRCVTTANLKTTKALGLRLAPAFPCGRLPVM